MRNNSNVNVNTNNNYINNPNSARHGANADNTFYYYNYANCNVISNPWSRQSPSNQNQSKNQSPSQPGKRIPGPPPVRLHYQQTAANSAPNPSLYDDAFGQPCMGNLRIAGNNKSCDYVYEPVRRQEDQLSNQPAEFKYRQQHQEQLPLLLQPSLVYVDPDVKKRKGQRAGRVAEYVDNSAVPVDRFYGRNSPVSELSWDALHSARGVQYPTTNQHYQHYFSYFYDRGGEKLPKKKFAVPNSRKLPMSGFQKPDGNRRDAHDFDGTIIVLGHPDANQERNWQNSKYDKHVLKEKLPSNDLDHNYLDNGWDDSLAVAGAGAGNGLRLKGGEDMRNFNDAAGLVDNQYEQVHRRYCRLSENAGIDAGGGDSLINNNNNELKLIRKPVDNLPMPRLPMTPKRTKGGTGSGKKPLPTVHRVLLYSTQSPRLGRKQQRTHSQKSRSPAGAIEDQSVLLVEPEPEQRSKIELRHVSPIDFDRNDEYDDDDDLDNISNFDESDTASVLSDNEDGYRAHAYKITHAVDRFASHHISGSYLSSQSSDEELKTPESLLVPSLFPFVPPYLSFSSNTKRGPRVPPELHRVLKWRVTNIMPKVVRLILANSGMRMLKSEFETTKGNVTFFIGIALETCDSSSAETNDWMGVWGKHLKSPCFKAIRSYQKINHLPGSFRIGRKDSCWKNLQRQMNKHSNKEFGFMPRTYIIPNDLGALRRHWPRYAQRNTKWIIKPPASARGAGIRVINRWGQIPKRRPLIVQKYIERPLLINGSKFDLRLYVLVTSVNPLRVFMYHNGLARFASVKYSAKTDTLNDRCMHLTNYSINKFSSNYSKNEDVNACHGHKWTIKSLWTYLANRGVRTDCLWEALRSLVLRTILAGENGINSMIRANVESKYSCFELFGFDVILDADLVPWLLEVNISPSLHSELPLDAHVKAPLVQGVLNTALYNVPPKLSIDKQRELASEFSFPPGTQMCYDKRLYINYLSREEKVKHNTFTRKSMEDRNEYVDDILTNLTPDDVRCLIIAEDELARCAPLERIFPTDQTHKYLKYNDSPRYYNRLLDAWESRYANNRTEGIALLRDLCQNKYHLQVPTPPAKK
ncbi:hypothetical protein KR018_006590, partial [Drosophila ironensis]